MSSYGSTSRFTAFASSAWFASAILFASALASSSLGVPLQNSAGAREGAGVGRVLQLRLGHQHPPDVDGQDAESGQHRGGQGHHDEDVALVVANPLAHGRPRRFLRTLVPLYSSDFASIGFGSSGTSFASSGRMMRGETRITSSFSVIDSYDVLNNAPSTGMLLRSGIPLDCF